MLSVWRWITVGLLIVALSLAIVSCSPVAPVVKKDPWYLPPDAHDMDKVVNMKGVPLNVHEQTSYIDGREIRDIGLMYSDEFFNFKSNADRSLTRLKSSQSVHPIPQRPLPVWFKVKYPHLDYLNIPTAQ